MVGVVGGVGVFCAGSWIVKVSCNAVNSLAKFGDNAPFWKFESLNRRTVVL